LCAVGVGFVVVSCGEEVPTALDEDSTPTVTESAADAAETPLFVVEAEAVGTCMGDESVGFVPGMSNPEQLNCTAEDVIIANADKISGPAFCVEGTDVTVTLQADILTNSEERRSDIGVWIATDGGDARVGSCQHFYFLDPQLSNFDLPADLCRDVGEKILYTGVALNNPAAPITIKCQDTNDDGFLDAGSCIGWKIPGADAECPDDADGNGTPGQVTDFIKGTLPGNKAKCKCGLVDIDIPVVQQAKIKVVKDLNPASDPGRFNLAIYDATAGPTQGSVVSSATNVGDGGDTGYWSAQWNTGDDDYTHTFYVQETMGTPNPGLMFYNSSYVCKDGGGTGSTVASGSNTGPSAPILLNSNDDVVCTFTNDRIAVPTITVTKDATPTFTREWAWTIRKQAFYGGDLTEIPTGTVITPLMPGQTVDVDYKVTVSPTPTDKGWAVSGTITVAIAGSLPPYAGTITVADTLTPGDIVAAVDCDDQTVGDQNTVAVTAAGSFTCAYSATLPDGTARTNTAYATTTWNSGDPGSNNGTAPVAFGSPTTETDEIAYVCDDKGSSPVSTPCTDTSGDYLGTATRAVGMFPYPNDVPACVPPGDNRLNTAKFTTNDTAAEDSARHALSWECNDPPPGCTLTQGYWKTHSEFGPAPYDDAWGDVIGTGATSCGTAGPPSIRPDGDGAGTGASVAFDAYFGTAVTNICYFDVFWTPPKGGNPWYMLAHQYIAAQMNALNGADATLVQSYLTEAKGLLAQYDNNQKIPKKSPDGVRAKELAGYLASYNEGTYPGGPPHCEDDGYPD